MLDFDREPNSFNGFGVNELELERGGFQREGVWAKKRELLHVAAGHCGTRLEIYNGNLSVRPWSDPYIEIDGDLVDVGGDVGLNLSMVTSLINTAGFPSGSAPASDVTYYAYVASPRGAAHLGLANTSEEAGMPKLRLSATAPSIVYASALGQGTSELNNHRNRLVGQKYLGQSDTARCWRFVGWVRLSGGVPVDSDTKRFVVSYYNRRKKRLFSCPAYNNNNAETSYTTTSTTYVAANAGTGALLEFIANGEDTVSVVGAFGKILHSTLNECRFGISDDNAATGVKWGGVSVATNTNFESVKVTVLTLPVEGYSTFTLMYATASGTLTVYADVPRIGANQDPYASFIEAEIMA